MVAHTPRGNPRKAKNKKKSFAFFLNFSQVAIHETFTLCCMLVPAVNEPIRIIKLLRGIPGEETEKSIFLLKLFSKTTKRRIFKLCQIVTLSTLSLMIKYGIAYPTGKSRGDKIKKCIFAFFWVITSDHL